MIDFKRVPLMEGLRIYTEEGNARFHMPGHRNEEALEEIMYLSQHLYDFDVTEVRGTDNLHYPEEIIKESQKLLAEAMGAQESLYCVNGSTASNYSMIFGLLKRQDQVLIQRNCHQSIYNAMALLDLDPVFLMPDFLEEFEIPATVSLEEIRKRHEAHREAKAVILTSPTYHGSLADIKAIATYCRENGLYLLVDEAHGAHFPFSSLLPASALQQGAHASSVSFHKTLPCLTQGSVLNLSSFLTDSERSRIRHYHRIFQTSSPSYPLLASMEMARYLMEKDGERLYAELLENIRELKKILSGIPGLRVYEGSDINLQDGTRLVISTPLQGTVVDGLLRRDFRIQCEMTEERNLIFILSPYDRKEDLLRIGTSLREIYESRRAQWEDPAKKTTVLPESYGALPKRRYSEGEVLFLEQEEVDLHSALNRVSMERVIPYPPGVPLLLPGEVISSEILDNLLRLKDKGANILKSRTGQKGTISVLK